MIRQHSFYMADEDWTRLRHHCLDAGVSVSAFIAGAALAAIEPPVPATKATVATEPAAERPFRPAPKPSAKRNGRS